MLLDKLLSEAIIAFCEEFVVILSEKFNVVYMNHYAIELFQRPETEIIGKNFNKLCQASAFYPAFSPSMVHKLTVSPQRTTIEVVQKAKKIIIEWRGKFLQKNTDSFFLLMGKDITQLKNAEDKIYELDSVIAQMPGNVYWYSKDLVYLGCNENSAKTLGISRAKVTGKNFLKLMKRIKNVKDEIIKSFVVDGQEVIISGQPKLNIEEPPFVGPEGSESYWLANKVPLRDRLGKIYGVIGISTDITQRKQLECELYLQKEKAEAANKAKSEFIANMSHDLRTPLSGLLGIAQSMQDSAENDRIREQAGWLVQCANELLNLFNGIIELVQLESGKVTQQETSFSLSELIQQNVALQTPIIQQKGLQLQVNIDPEIPPVVFGNKTLLHRIILNLLSNAIKFTHHGNITINVQLLTQLNDSVAWIEIVIADTGIGIPADKLEEIFEHFARLSPAYEGVYEGSGIGLYTVKSYVQLLKGEIKVNSAVGKGSQFTVQIPLQVTLTATDMPALAELTSQTLAQATVPVEIKTANRNPEQRALINSDGAMKVLLIEDHPIVARVTLGLLQALGCTVDHAATGQQALAKIQQGHYDLIYLDIGLPDMDGLVVAQHIRQLPDCAKASVPIIALTGHKVTKQREACVQVGIQEMLTKPLTRAAAELSLQKYGCGERNEKV